MSRGHWQCRVLQVAGKVWTASEAATRAKSLRENQVLYGTAAEAVPFHDQVLTSFKSPTYCQSYGPTKAVIFRSAYSAVPVVIDLDMLGAPCQ
jgi:hypothetical protein